jgi:3-deoxy-D-manno-octulosonic-acid transferase
LKLKALIAPHDVSPQNLKRVAETIQVPFTWLSKSEGPPETDIIVVDSIGLLSSLYALGKVAYVGGGFSKGIHNTLEPIAHGKAVIFGPRYSIFPEAIESIEKGFGFSIHGSNDLRLQLEHLLHDEELLEKRKLALEYIEQFKGATDVISDYLLNSIPFSEQT